MVWQVFTRALNFCIVDEVDSVLLDFANQPLILSNVVRSPKIENQLTIATQVECTAGFISSKACCMLVLNSYGVKALWSEGFIGGCC